MGVVLEHPHAPHGLLRDAVGDNQIAVGVAVGATYPATDLVELREPEAVRPVDDQRVGVGDVQAVLDDGGTHQHVHFAVHEIAHHLVELHAPHLAVGYGHRCIGHQSAHLPGRAVDRLHAVVEEEDLSAPVELPRQSVTQDMFAPRDDVGHDGDPVARRSSDEREVAQAGQSKLEGAWDRRGREGKHVERGPHPLEPLLVADPESLFLVDDKKAEVLEDDIPGEEAMRPDDDVQCSLPRFLQQAAGLVRAAEAVQRPDVHRVVGESFSERARVLFDQHSGGREDGDLFAVLDRLEGGSNGDLGLAVSDIAANEPVHGSAGFHVPFDVFDRPALVARVLVEEGRLHFPLPARVGREGVTLGHLPAGV